MTNRPNYRGVKSFLKGGFLGALIVFILIVIICYISFWSVQPPKREVHYFTDQTVNSMHQQVEVQGYSVIWPDHRLSEGDMRELKRNGFVCDSGVDMGRDFKYTCKGV